jgi:hypothetical protein
VSAALAPSAGQAVAYARRRPETTALYEVVRDNLETLYGAIDDGALGVKIPAHARKELDAYLDCGLLCRGFARLRCESCGESRLVAFACKGRGFCPSCTGRRMCATSADLVDRVLPATDLRQWVMTFPFSWRSRLAHDGKLFGALTRIFVDTVHRFYAERAAKHGVARAKSGAVTVVQRTSSDLRLNPHLHVVFLDGAYHEPSAESGELCWQPLGHLKTSEVGEVLEHTVRRIEKHLRRRGLLDGDVGVEPANDIDDDASAAEHALAASAVSGQAPPAGPQWLRGLSPLSPQPLAFGDKPLCAALDGFTLHAATRAGAHDLAGREALLRYVLRPPVAQERVERQPDGLVRIALKRPFADGTVAVEMDPLSLLCRLATSVPPPRYHQVKYAGVLAPASAWRARIAPTPPTPEAKPDHDDQPQPKRAWAGYKPWAELLARTFALDVLRCPKCDGRMKLLALITDTKSAARFLAKIGEPTDVPGRSPSRGPPYWKSTVLRRKAGAGDDQ